MSSRLVPCALCGWFVSDVPGRVSWANQFRGLYNGPTGIELTGLGLYNPGIGKFIAPTDPNARWDDEGYNSPTHDCFGAMTQEERNGRHGFVFHDACWRIFQKNLGYQGTHAQEGYLFQICRSFPFQLRGTQIAWGADADNFELPDHYFSWEVDYDISEVLEADETQTQNPYDNITEIDQILDESPELPPNIFPNAGNGKTIRNDPFKTLPAELCSAIAESLPTSDVLNARLASRSFTSMFYDQQFWASRFKGGLDREWLFEAREWRSITDWRWLYRRTHVSRIGPQLRNRRRVWKISSTVIDLLKLQFYNLGTSVPHYLKIYRSIMGAAGDLFQKDDRKPLAPRFLDGCRLLHAHLVTIPNNLSQFSISLVHTPAGGYVSGIKFTTATGNVMQLGYWGGPEYSTDATNIWGFVLSIGSRGFRAVKCVMENDTTSKWLGNWQDGAKPRRLARQPENNPTTSRLAGFNSPIDTIEVGFDVRTGHFLLNDIKF
ncbi:F-box domain-containing protein [Nemania sp. FL0916]|nr:F-box domain-containing protein [Nemania sp. FL0916]